MLERDMRKQVVKLLRADLGAFAVENGGCHPGTPDVACTLGWIECKATNQWPARADTKVKLDHDLTQQQRIWLLKWEKVGGDSWVLINIDGTWMLFQGGRWAAYHIGKMTQHEMRESALRVWEQTPKTKELVDTLVFSPTPGR